MEEFQGIKTLNFNRHPAGQWATKSFSYPDVPGLSHVKMQRGVSGRGGAGGSLQHHQPATYAALTPITVHTLIPVTSLHVTAKCLICTFKLLRISEPCAFMTPLPTRQLPKFCSTLLTLKSAAQIILWKQKHQQCPLLSAFYCNKFTYTLIGSQWNMNKSSKLPPSLPVCEYMKRLNDHSKWTELIIAGGKCVSLDETAGVRCTFELCGLLLF